MCDLDNELKKYIDNMSKKFWIFLGFLILISNNIFAYIDEPYHDTAFIGPANTFYGLTYFSYYRTDHFWNKNGHKHPSFNKFNRQAYRLDMEYDINGCNAIFLKGGYTMVDEHLNGRSRGLEDPELSWQCLFFRNSCSAFSGKLTAIIPIGPKKSCVRYGKFGVELKALYSKCFDLLHHRWWMDLGLGYRLYSGFPSDQIRADATLGFAITSRSWLISSTQLYYGIFNGDSNANRNNICFNPNFRLLTTQLQGIVEINKYFSITTGGFVHLWGENVGSGGGFFSGLWIIF